MAASRAVAGMTPLHRFLEAQHWDSAAVSCCASFVQLSTDALAHSAESHQQGPAAAVSMQAAPPRSDIIAIAPAMRLWLPWVLFLDA